MRSLGSIINKILKILIPKRYTQVVVGYCSANLMLPLVFTLTKSVELRRMLFLPSSKHVAQLIQDVFAFLVNRYKQAYFLCFILINT